MQHAIRTLVLGLIALSPIDAHRLKTGRFTYQALDHGQEVGRDQLTIRRLAGPERYDFLAEVSGHLTQRWEAVVTPSFEPLSATITFGPDTAGNTPAFSLTYNGQHVTGFLARTTRRDIDTIVPAGIIDQRVDWAAVMASDLTPGRHFSFAVYDPALGVSQAQASVGPVEHLQVPAGTFDAYRVTYRIAKATGTVEYQVLTTRDLPRIMLREEFPDGVVTNLVAMQ
jgi:hypothetical protein